MSAVETESMSAERAGELHAQRERSELLNRTAPPPTTGKPEAAAAPLPDYPMETHAEVIGQIATAMGEFGGREAGEGKLAVVTFMTYPAGKRWGRSLEELPAWAALAMAVAGLGLLAIDTGIVGKRAEPPAAPAAPGPQQRAAA